MAVSALAGKGLLIKGAGSLAVLSGASIGGYYIYEKVFNSGIKIRDLKVNDYFVPSPKSCFNGHFPGASFTKDVIDKTEVQDTVLTDPTKPTGTPAPDVEGCTIMRYSGKKSKDKQEWAFESETSVKKGKVGIVTWLEVNSLDANNQRYQIYLLEENTNKAWEVKYGFISDKVEGLTKIKSSNEKIKLTYASDKWSSDVSGDFEYKWNWKKDETKGNNLWSSFLEISEPSKFTAKYTYQGNKLHEKEKDVKAKLEKWFDIFKDSKGTWETVK